MKKRTTVYIDGFNFYYSAAKPSGIRWLDFRPLLNRVFPQNDVTCIKYFTADVSSQPGNPDAPQRQQTYLRALATTPDLRIIKGHFRTREKMMKVVTPPPPRQKVYVTEEKGSDVNIAAHLLMDGFQNRYEVAIVVSGDSDLITPIWMVKTQLLKPVGVLNPQLLSGSGKRKTRHSAGLREAATFYKHGIRFNQMSGCEFPRVLKDSQGSFHKPKEWQ